MPGLTFKVILVEPVYEGNVGSVARVMKNFGFRELALVNPCPLGSEARKYAMHAHDILENAIIADSLKEAAADSNLLIGTTGNPGVTTKEHVRMPPLTPAEVREKLKDKTGTVSLVFGREDKGLTNEELIQCDIVSTIPTSEDYPSLNLSHAVAVTLYELSEIYKGTILLADRTDVELLYDHLKEIIDEIDYKQHKKEKTMVMLRRIFGRAELTGREVQTLRGLLRKMQGKRREKTQQSQKDPYENIFFI